MNPGYKAFFDTLHGACLRGESGVVHLFTQDGQYGKVGLEAGTITHLALHNTRGMAALPLLVKASISSHRLEHGGKLPAQPEIGKTLFLLTALEEALGNQGLRASRTQLLSAVEATGQFPVAKPAAAAITLSEPQLTCLREELEREVGPMAESLVKEQLPKARSALHLAELLSEQLMPAEGRIFLARVGTRLAALP